MSARDLPAALLFLALASCTKMRVVDPGVASPPRVKDADEVVLYTPETGPPQIAHHANGELEVSAVIDFKTGSPRDNGFDHLRSLREAGYDRGCHAVVVSEPQKHYDDYWCSGTSNPRRRPCLLVYRATCVVFD